MNSLLITFPASYLVSNFQIRFNGINANENDDYFLIDDITIAP
ncbi:MAG: hypothetical protein R3E31_20060 [Chloroflexota bacterium]